MEIKKAGHARHELWYHLAFSTKYRKQLFNDEKTKEEAALLFREIALRYDLEVGQVQVLSGHVYLTPSLGLGVVPISLDNAKS